MFRNRNRIAGRTAGAVGAAALLGAGLVAAPAAHAETVLSSYAKGQFVSGSLLGANLDGVLTLEPAVATNDGTQPTQVAKDPLGVVVLQSVGVNADGGVQLDAGDPVDAGAISQYARAQADGVSFASSGAIGSDGAVGVGSVGSGASGDLSVDLNPVLDSAYGSVLTDLRLRLDAVAAQAHAELDVATGDYRLAGAVLTLSSPAIANLTQKVSSALDEVDSSLVSLGSDGGAIGIAVDDVLDPVLGAIGSSANVSVVIDADVRSAVQSLLNGAYAETGVRFNLEAGTVDLDLEALLGADLNDLPPGTELIQDAVLGEVLRTVLDKVDSLADQIVDRVEAALHDATVTVSADLDLLTPQGSTQEEVCRVIDVPIIGDLLGDGGILGDDGILGDGGLLGGGGGGGLLGGLLGKSVGHAPLSQDIIGWTTETVCEIVETVLPDLRSTVDVNVTGSVDDLLNGTATTATAAISLLGGTVNAGLDVDLVVDAIGDGLLDGLFGDDGTIDRLTEALDTLLVDPAETGLLGGTSVYSALSSVLSVRVNLQETDSSGEGTMFTQTAVRISVLSGAATLDVAAATVGPNVGDVVDCITDCGPGGEDPDCVTNCGPGGPGNPIPTGSGGGNLALTGIGIGMLIQLILGLLAAGAILAYAGYRDKHPIAS